ncbi:SWIM zinc finger domain-containing protein [Synechocystis sp. LEGE 06083]|uniref:SWIM zinc finger family protein n=1 Tax=Synechocystis sp. LEGE 06083 TaxID=915336 RepID=UPI001880FE66|nr:SWIM zinc finger family protein [Synechocystis sp. LEGE 06083]MBE9195934.1 SWIM zinc finger domain-containing protein [Synechocystis sp. LEGE 06083]
MTDLPQISEQHIADCSTSQSFQRGADYFQQGAVESLIKRGNLITAQVRGSYIYDVCINFEGNNVISTQCSCPYKYGDWCKHIVATLLNVCRCPHTVQERPSLPELLGDLDKEQIIEIMIALVGKEPKLLNKIEKIVRKQYIKKVENNILIDTNYYRGQIRDAIRETEIMVSEYWEGEDESELPCEEIVDLIDEVRDLGLGERLGEAIAALTVITETCVREWPALYEYGIYGYDIYDQISELWAELILAADFSDLERGKLSRSLKKWRERGEPDYDLATLAIAEMWELPALRKVLAAPGQRVNLTPEEQESLDTPLLAVRLEVLKKQKKYEEYLALAMAAGAITNFLRMLAYLDRVEEVMANADQIENGQQALQIAEGLVEVGAMAEAITIARLGLTLKGEDNYDYELLKLIAELARETEQPELHLASLLKAVQVRPCLADFHQLVKISGEDWQFLKDDLFEHLLNLDDRWGYSTKVERIRIFLASDYVRGAMVLASQLDRWEQELLRQVMLLALKSNPQWVIDNGVPRAEEIMDSAQSKYYDRAAELLALVKKGYEAMDRSPEWQNYLGQLMKAHSRKRNLIPLLQGL